MSSVELSKNKIGSSVTSSRITSTTSFDDEQIAIHRRENLIYPLFSEVSQSARIPPFVYFITQFISLLQFFISGLWPNSAIVWGYYPEGNEAVHIIQYFVDIGLHVADSKDNFVTYIILIAIFVIIIGWNIFCLVYYHFFHQFNKPMLYLTQITQMVILPPVLPLFASHAGQAFSRLATDSLSGDGVGAAYAALFTIFIIFTFVLFLLFYVCFSFASLSPILLQAFDATWTPQPIIYMMFIICFRCFFGPVLDHFDKYLLLIFVIVTMLINAYVIYTIKDFPFHKFWINPSFAGFAFGQIILAIFIAIRIYNDVISPTIFIIISLVMSIIGVAVIAVILNIRRKKIVSQLSYSSIGQEPIEEPAKRAHFETLSVKTAKDIEAYLRIGLSSNCDLFLDFSFPHFAIENYPTKEVILSVAHMISFFPSELQFLAYCLGMLSKVIQLSFHEHFLYFQLKKVHLMRQSSLSKEAATTIRKIRKQSKEVISAIRGFWKEVSNGHANLDFNSLIAVENSTNKLIGTFQDLTERFSNNQEMCEEYTYFLVEGAGNYQEAVKWKSKAHHLELGHRLDTDFALKSLVNTYPHYLMNKIIDTNGKFIKSNAQVESTNQSEISTNASSFMSIDANDHRYDDISNNLFTESKLRLSLQSTLESATLPGLASSKFLFALQAIIVLLVFIVILCTVPTISNDLNTTIDEITQITSLYSCMGYTSFIASYLVTTHPAHNTFGGLDTAKSLLNFPTQEHIDAQPLNIFTSPYAHLNYYVKGGALSLKQLLMNLMSHPNDRLDALDIFLYTYFNLHYSSNNTINPQTNADKSIRASIFDGFYWLMKALQQNEAGLADENPIDNFLLCGFYNMIQVSVEVENVQLELTKIGNHYVSNKKQVFTIVQIVLPIVFGIFFIILQSRQLYLLYKKTKVSVQILRQVNEETIDESLNPIQIGTKEKRINIGSSQIQVRTSLAYTILPYFIIFGVIVNSLTMFLTFYLGLIQFQDVGSIFDWFRITSNRVGAIFQCLTAIQYISVCTEDTPRDKFKMLLNNSYNKLCEAHLALLGGDVTMPRLVGFDDVVDNDHFLDTCDTPPDEYYKFFFCLATDRAVNEAEILLRRIIIQFENGDYNLSTLLYANVLVLVDFKLANQLFEFQDALTAYSRNEFGDVSDYMIIGCIIGIIASILIFILSYLIIHSFDVALEGIRHLIRLLPPSMILKNKSLVRFIVGSGGTENERFFTPAQAIVTASGNATISISLDYTINSVNPAFKNVTGLVPDEVLGQPLSILFPFPQAGTNSTASITDNASLQELYDKLEEMKNSETGNVTESLNMKCTNDVGKPLHVKVTIIAIKGDTDKTESFVMILRDMAAERQLEIAAKNAKKRSEQILHNLLPASVYENLMKSDDDASTLFISNNATVISVKIVGLLDCVNSLAPSQLIQVLQKINEAFDETASNYPSVHPIMTHDDLIVACCGIFDFIDQPKEQCSQAVMFAMEFNSLIDDLNEQLVVDLQFKIAVNYGGPLTGNVLNRETPSFGLLGPVMALATKMNDDGPPGNVIITESVYQLLDQTSFIGEKWKPISLNNLSLGELCYKVKDIQV